MQQATCSVEGCGNPIKRVGYCYGHYMKNWRYGTPIPSFPSRWQPLEGMTFGELKVVRREGSQWVCTCSCGAEIMARSGDLNRGRETITCGDRAVHHRTDTAEYHAAHDRIHRDRGPARDRVCVGCGAQAAQWSYNHDDPDERSSASARTLGIAYSLDPARYSPKCVPCHKRFDLDLIDSRRIA